MRRAKARAGRRAVVFYAVIALDALVLAAWLRGDSWARRLTGKPYGDARLVAAAMSGDIAEVAGALAEGACPDARADASEETALMWAAGSGDVACVRRLLDVGADARAMTSRGQTPLSAAVVGGHADVVRLLVARGADVNACSPVAGTALRRAALMGNGEMTDLLLSLGADPAVAGTDGETPLAVCEGLPEREEVARRLRSTLAAGRRRVARVPRAAVGLRPGGG